MLTPFQHAVGLLYDLYLVPLALVILSSFQN